LKVQYLYRMFLYNVTIGIDKDVEQEMLVWMKAEHIPKIMETGMFVEFKMYKVLHDQDDGGVSYSVQFFAHTINHVTTYFDKFAPIFLDQLRTRFRDKHVAFMTLLEEV
jgi:Domain of unknown function (DUF4286)